MSTLKVDTILKRTGTGTITGGQSGDTISIPSGATLNSAGTNTLNGIANTPSFYAALTSSQTISDNTITKIQFNTEVWDTDSAYDNSTNYRFTVPSGQAGKYCFMFQGAINITRDYQLTIYLRKNGSTIGTEFILTNGYQPSASTNMGATYHQILDLSASDYVEIYAKLNNNGSSSNFLFGDNFTTFFTGYKLLGV